ncbi:hypothetical protein Tco_0927125 [Tanacetum coccineum]|uniref:Uncharacterized protein n=1 Tax=Tanacetum coccineum TaxID=301880 RepID=A0ABQ5DEK5_9ASTR
MVELMLLLSSENGTGRGDLPLCKRCNFLTPDLVLANVIFATSCMYAVEKKGHYTDSVPQTTSMPQGRGIYAERLGLCSTRPERSYGFISCNSGHLIDNKGLMLTLQDEAV